MNNLVKRILGTIAVTAAVALSGFLLPETVLLPDLSVTASADTDFTEAATWTELKDALAAGGNVRLKEDVTADTALVVPSGKTVTLDLNGHTIDRGLDGNDLVKNGNVITVNGNLTLTDSSDNPETAKYDGTGTITGGKNIDNGGGVWVSGSGTFTMTGGTISGCSTNDDGGGVYVENGGEFTMTGGTISGWWASSYGGGVYVGESGTFTMKGGTISNGVCGDSGGVYVGKSGTFTMEAGTISGCSATNRGGGVYVDYGTFTMTGGTISGCSAQWSGVGVGGGVYVYGTFNISGSPVISGNTKGNAANNVEFASYNSTKTINVIDELTEDAIIYVTAEKGSTVAVGSGGYTLKAEDAECFHSDSDGLASVLETEDNTNKVKFVGAWFALQSKLNNASTSKTSPTKIKLSDNVTAEDGDNALVVPAGKYVTLDLNGHTINRGLTSPTDNGNVITVNGSLTLTDSSKGEPGTITGGKNKSYGGGVYVYKGTFNMNGGEIRSCSAIYGGGVFVGGGTFTMSGGTISGCSAGNNIGGGGGGVYVDDATFTMNGGTISGCSSVKNGGGVYVYGTFTMSGGTISDCDVGNGGGGVYVVDGTFNVSGAPVISGNNKGDDTNNVEFYSDHPTKTINVIGTLAEDAIIYVNAGKGSAVAVGGSGYILKAEDAECFHSDIDTELPSVLVTDDNTNKVKFAGEWEALQSKLNNASTSKTSPTTITLSGTVTAEDGDNALVVPEGKYVTLDLNGHTINRGLTSSTGDGNVITVKGNLTLTDTSTGGTITGGKTTGYGGGVYVDGGTFAMNGGTISGCSAIYGGVFVSNVGTFTMSGGTISSCSASFGGGVLVFSGTFTMNGGTISGCSATGDGGGVVVNGTFTMQGGTISGCSAADDGGGVYVNGGEFTMNGGTISGCSAKFDGGGVYVSGYGTFTMSGGTISGCSAQRNGGGVCVDSGTFNVSGAPVISGNKKGNTANNVVFASDHSTKTINVTGTLTEDASIYVNAGEDAAVAVGSGYTLKAEDAKYFHSDIDPALVSALDNDKIVFKTKLPEPADIASATYNGNAQSPELSFGSETLTKGTDYTVTCKLGDTVVTETKNAGTYTVTVTGIGAYAGTYEKSYTINKRPVTVGGIKANNKTYDGTTAAELDYTGAAFGKCGSDDLTITATGTFDNANAGTGKTVSITDITLGGASAGNYVLAENGQQTATTADINVKPVTVTADNKTKTVGENDPTLTATVTGLVGSDTVNYTLSREEGDEIGTYTITPSGEAEQGNYTVTYKTGTLTIKSKTVAVTGVTLDKTTAELTVNEKLTLTATVKPDNATDKTVKWTSDYPTVATVSNGIVTAVSEGKATITATAGGKSATCAVTVKTANNGGNSGNGGSGGYIPSYPSGGSTTPSTPTTPVKKPEPKVGDKEGVPAIIEEIGKIPEGGTLPINMNGTTELPKEIIEALKGKDVNLVLDMGGGVTWTINGKDISSVSGSIDLGVKLGTSGIPVEVKNNVTGEKYSTTLHLNHSGAFGFKAVMTVPLRKQDAGLFANLFYYNPSKKVLEFVSSAKIDANGNADLDFNHASDYAIIIDDHSLDNPQFTAAVDGSSVKLTWDAVSGAAKYNVYVAKNGKWSKFATTKKTTLTVAKLKNNKTYKFLVRAKVNGKLTPVSESYKLTVKVCYKPVLKATTKNGTITLKWSAVNNATEYRVVKYTNGEWKLVKETSKLSQTIRGLNSGKTYKYAVQAKVNDKWTSIGTTSTATVKVK